jgi:DNA-binding CsgD family transcriptional regulator
MKNCRAFRSHHDPEVMIAWIKGGLACVALSDQDAGRVQIARQLFVSEATVKSHINRLFAKTGTRDRAQAIRCAHQHGLTPP